MTAAHRLHALPRGRRLQLPGEFLRVRNEGRRIVVGCLIVNWMETKRTGSRLGVVTSRKIGSAVIRNRARRLMRECFRRHAPALLQNVDLVMVARNSIGGRALEEVEHDYLAALHRGGLIEQPA